MLESHMTCGFSAKRNQQWEHGSLGILSSWYITFHHHYSYDKHTVRPVFFVHADVIIYEFETRFMALCFHCKQQPDSLYQSMPPDMYKEIKSIPYKCLWWSFCFHYFICCYFRNILNCSTPSKVKQYIPQFISTRWCELSQREASVNWYV